jgi:hypothetical protein
MKKRPVFSYKDIKLGSNYFRRSVLKMEPCQSLSGQTFEVVYITPEGRVRTCRRKTFADWVRRQIRKKEQQPPTSGMALGHT